MDLMEKREIARAFEESNEDLEAQTREIEKKLEQRKHVEKNIDETKSPTDEELKGYQFFKERPTPLSERRGVSFPSAKYTERNMRIVRSDPVYQKLNALKEPALARIYILSNERNDSKGLVLESTLDRIFTLIAERKMGKKEYEFWNEKSEDACIKQLLTYSGMNLVYDRDAA